MDQEHHQQHRKERAEKRAEQKAYEHDVERSPGRLHPLWYLAVGFALTMIATLIWTVFYAGSF